MSGKLNRYGYPNVNLRRDGGHTCRTVHGLVMAAFVGPRPDGMEVRHLDGNPGNPRLENLAYGTPSENQLDRRAHGTDLASLRTHCPRGHEFTPANTYRSPTNSTGRQCRTCTNARALARYYQRKAAQRAASSA